MKLKKQKCPRRKWPSDIFISFSVRPSTPTQKKSYYCIPIPGDFGFGSIFIFSGYFIRAREMFRTPRHLLLPSPFSILNYIRSPDEMALYFIAIFFQNFHFFFLQKSEDRRKR